jgi:hypothetical protein
MDLKEIIYHKNKKLNILDIIIKVCMLLLGFFSMAEEPIFSSPYLIQD